MFLGRYDHNIDEKGRLTIPARFREELEHGAYITRGFDKNLMILTKSGFEKIYARVNQLSMTNFDARLLKRLIFSDADNVLVDKIGRVRIQAYLREAAGLDNKVVVVGTGDYIEIWNPGLWLAQTDLLNDSETTMRRFEALDLNTASS